MPKLDKLAFFELIGFWNLTTVLYIYNQAELVDGNIRTFPTVDGNTDNWLHAIYREALSYFCFNNFPSC